MQFSQLISLALLGAATLSTAAMLDKRNDLDTCYGGVSSIEAARASFGSRGANFVGDAQIFMNNELGNLDSLIAGIKDSCGRLESALEEGGV